MRLGTSDRYLRCIWRKLQRYNLFHMHRLSALSLSVGLRFKKSRVRGRYVEGVWSVGDLCGGVYAMYRERRLAAKK